MGKARSKYPAEVWNQYRETITQLRSHMTLQDVQDYMKTHYNFDARLGLTSLTRCCA